MATFDYDVVIIGSGFGGSVAALRAGPPALEKWCSGDTMNRRRPGWFAWSILSPPAMSSPA